MKTVIFLSLLSVALVGCDTNPVKPTPPVLIPEKTTIVIPPSLLKECGTLPKFEVRLQTEGQVVDALNNWITIHNACKLRHDELVKIVKDAFNTKETVPSK